MPLIVELHGFLWRVYQDEEEVFSGDYRNVEDWLDHAEMASKYPQSFGPVPPRRRSQP
jgi:hypothetical protein